MSGKPEEPETSLPAILRSQHDVDRAMAYLAASCPVMREIGARVGTPALRRYPPGFEGIARIVVGQQLSVASARAIWARLKGATGKLTPEAFLALGSADLKAAGLSAAKRDTCTALATAIVEGRVRLAGSRQPRTASGALREWSGVREDLSRIKGIGPWTLDIYEMFCLRRADAFASGDLALKEALRLCEQTESRLTTKALEARSLAWSPVRAVAAKALWADYTQRRAGSR